MRARYASSVGEVRDRDPALGRKCSNSIHDTLVKGIHGQRRAYDRSVPDESGIPDLCQDPD